MKNKETLEEAAERLFKIHSNNTSLAEGHYDYMMDKEDFKEASLEIAKWQQERMYSEEDMKRAFDVGFQVGYNDETSPSYLTAEKFIEQFKKK